MVVEVKILSIENTGGIDAEGMIAKHSFESDDFTEQKLFNSTEVGFL